MECGIIVLQQSDVNIAEIVGTHPADFACSETLLEEIRLGYDYGSFQPWGQYSTDHGSALCFVSRESNRDYIIVLACDGEVDLQEAADFLHIVAPKLALAANLGRLEENLPRLAELVLKNLAPDGGTPPQFGQIAPREHLHFLTPLPTENELKVCPFRMNLPEGEQHCIQDRCIAYFGDIGQALTLLEQLYSSFSPGASGPDSLFGDLKNLLPKNGCFLIHGTPFSRIVPSGR